MLILLPPSETKRDGGLPGSRLDLASLSFPGLTRPRRAAIAGLRRVSRSLASATKALGLGPTQHGELERNRRLGVSPVSPAIERYTGVLYDGLDAAALDPAARDFLDRHVVIHSALFGLVRAGDLIPAYRFSHDSSVEGLPLGALWRNPIAATLAEHDGLVLDLRSEAYASLGPAPRRENSVFLRVVTEGDGGVKRALNHFNKKGKGEFLRALAGESSETTSIDSVGELLVWARSNGIRLDHGAPGELELVV